MQSSYVPDDYGAREARQAILLLVRISLATLIAAAGATAALLYLLA
jgi:hypothetical protein